jgi:hypothetical protein
MADNTINHAAYNAIDLMLDTADNMTLSQLLFVYQSIEVKLRDKGWTQ